MLSFLSIIGCGGGAENEADYLNPDLNKEIPRDNPDNNLPDDENNPDIGIPEPPATPVPAGAYRGGTIISETEHYSTEVSAPTLALSFGLLESSGGNYELEPAL